MSDLLEQIQRNGVVGAGGAGFPTHVKLKASAQFILLNAAECEPLLHKDKELLLHFGRQVLEGLETARQLVGAEQAIIGIKGKYTHVIEALAEHLRPDHRIQPLTDSYPAGDEFILVYDLTGRIIPPGKLPLTVGCVVINVETALNIARNQPVTVKYLTVAGAVAEPVTVAVPIGTPLAQVIELAGGPTTDDPVALVGGVMMGRFCDDLTQPVTKTTGGLVVLDRSHRLAQRYSRSLKQMNRIGSSACDQCAFCTYYCPRYLLGHPIQPHAAMRSLQFNLAGQANTWHTRYCCECNLCTMMACPEDLYPAQTCGDNKRRLQGQPPPQDLQPVTDRPALLLNHRRVPIDRLILKLGLRPFRNVGPLTDATVSPSRLVLPLNQHVGPPARPCVAVGQAVQPGQMVAQPQPGQLGAVLHSPVAGTVTRADEQCLVIES